MKKNKFYHSSFITISTLFLFGLVLPGVSFAEITASLAWSDSDGQQEQIYFSRYADGVWQNPVQLTKGESLDYLPSSGKGGDDTTWVVWSSKQGNSILLRYAFDSGNGWAEPVTINTGMSSNTAVSLVVDQQNIPWIVWAGFDGNDDEIFWSRLNDGQWTRPERVTAANDVPDLLPLLSMDRHGVLTVRWQSFNGEKYVTASRSFVDERWQEVDLPERKMTLQSQGKRNLIAHPQIPDFVPDRAKAKMHVRQSQ